MKAIRVQEFGGPDVMKLETTDDLKPGLGQVLVRVKAAGVNPVDSYVRSGTYASKPALPYTPGADGAGVVEAPGSGALHFKPGDRVYFNAALSGSYAEFALVMESNVHPLPEKVSFSQGAALGVPYGTAHQALFGRARCKPEETLLVHGASGGVGVAAVQLGRRAGLTVIGTAGTDKGLELVKASGAHFTLNHHDPEFGLKLAQLTSGRGVQVILEMLANVNLGRDLTYLSKFGRVVIIGSRGPVEINPREVMMRDAAILGMTLFNATVEDLREIHEDLGRGLAEGSLKPVVGREIPLSEAPRSHAEVMAPGAYGKIVLVP
jgi:NADPH2:quinone reductase